MDESNVQRERRKPNLVRPVIEPLRLSTKKERLNSTPLANPPRRLLYRSAPIHRFNSSIGRVQSVIKSANGTGHSVDGNLSKKYNSTNPCTYFKQCFNSHGLIGRGCFGDVYEVQSLDDGRLYAIKRSKERYRTERERLKFHHEALKYQEISPHHNLVKFFRSWEEENHLYIQLELCPITLSSHLETVEQDAVEEKFCWTLATDITSALIHLQDHKLLHLDVKPDNIFISRDNVFKLGDLGLISDATRPIRINDRRESSSPEHSCGDPRYLAPEMLKGIRTYKADIFSLGITLLEVSCDLDLPGSGPLWHSLRTGELPLDKVTHISCDFQRLMKWMINPNHEHRPAAPELMGMSAKLNHFGNTRRSELKWIGFKSIVYDWKVTIQWRLDSFLQPLKNFLTSISLVNMLVKFFTPANGRENPDQTPTRDLTIRSDLYEPITPSFDDIEDDAFISTPLDETQRMRIRDINFLSTHAKFPTRSAISANGLTGSPTGLDSSNETPTGRDKLDEDEESKIITGTKLDFDSVD